jgi:hypothetical protein
MRTLFVAGAWVLFAGTLAAQPSLRITSPASGTLFNPGQSIKVVVEATGVFKDVLVIGGGPLGATVMLPAPPYQWTIELPKDICPGPYNLTATGFGPPPKPIDSDTVTIQVELPEDARFRLAAEFPIVEFHLRDALDQLTWGVFPDGHRVDLNKSSRISYKSSAPNVATVDQRGEITAVAPGSATETIMYRDLHIEIPVTVLPIHQ